ncbi:MAG: MBL fold metallo-hydrolase [Brotaphodocola sp.]
MSDFRIKTCVLGPVSTNCYLIYHEQTREAVIIDPADSASRILDKCREWNIKPSAILLTHGHFDHILAVEDVKEAYSCSVYAGRGEEPMLLDPGKNMTAQMGGRQVSIHPDYLLQDGDVVKLAGFNWKVLETPGHTPGGVCYYCAEESVLISGDTLFAESLGRTDFPGGSTSAIIKSISEKLFALPDDTMVYPGHGDPTTIGHEKKYNPVAFYARRNR